MPSIFDENIRCKIFSLFGDNEKDEKMLNDFFADMPKNTEIVNIKITSTDRDTQETIYIFYKT